MNLDDSSKFYGAWADSGAQNSTLYSGGFVQLLSYLREQTFEETAEYILDNYPSDMYFDIDRLTLDTSGFDVIPKRKQLDSTVLHPYQYRHPYLEQRGISENVQRFMRIGYDRQRKAVVIPWFTPDGRLANVKYRRISDKLFWYERGAIPIRELLYGMDVIYRTRKNIAYIVEGEIDAMYVMTAGFPAIATGGAYFSGEKADLIARSPIETLVIATDNDEAGMRLKAEIIGKLTGKVRVGEIHLPECYKDVNDVRNTEELRNILTEYTSMGITVPLSQFTV